jgi:chemosensory pili system protein ChpA (sensor histidine kinase/response regulator)
MVDRQDDGTVPLLRGAMAESLKQASQALLGPQLPPLAGPDRDALRSVVSAVCDELRHSKQRLDEFVQSDRQHVDELNGLLPALRQVADTLAVLGFGQPRKVIIDQVTVIQGLSQGQREPNDAVLMDVAGALLYVEATLAGMIGASEEDEREVLSPDSAEQGADMVQIHRVVLIESRACLQEALDLIDDCLDNGSDPEPSATHDAEPHQALRVVPELLDQVRGALEMIGLQRAADLLRRCRSHALQHWQGPSGLSQDPHVEALASALTAIDFYLGRRVDNPQSPAGTALAVAEENLARLAPLPASTSAPIQRTEAIADIAPEPLTIPVPRAVDIDPIDDELRAIFLEEAAELSALARDSLAEWRQDPAAHGVAVIDLRRCLHTLKGSGRMVAASVASEMCWAAEHLLNRVVEHCVEPGPAVFQAIEQLLAQLPALLDDFAHDTRRQHPAVETLVQRLTALAEGQVAPDAPLEAIALSAAGLFDADGFDRQLLEIFRHEALTHLATLEGFLRTAADSSSLPVSDAMQRAVHTLKGSAWMAGVLPIAALATAMDRMVREFKSHRWPIEAAQMQLLRQVLEAFKASVRRLPAEPLAVIEGAEALMGEFVQQVEARLQRGDQGSVEPQWPVREPQLISRFLEQGMDILLDAESVLEHWRQHPAQRQDLTALLDELTTLGQGAHLADLVEMDELCEALLDVYGAVEESSVAVSEPFFAAAHQAHEALINMLDQVAAGQEIDPQPGQIAGLRELLESGLAPGATGLVEHGSGRITELSSAIRGLDSITAAAPNKLADATAPNHFSDAGEPAARGLAPKISLPDPGQAPSLPDDAPALDEVAELFLEQAWDILASADQALQRWLSEPDNSSPLTTLRHDLETLDGGAQMAEVAPIGALAEALLPLYLGLQDKRLQADERLGALLTEAHGALAALLRQYRAGASLSDPQALLAALSAWRRGAASPASESLQHASRQAALDTPGPDHELLEIFLEEASDIIESASAALLRWRGEPQNSLEVENLLRDLHTLKGGARMVEITAIGDLTHELEFLYESVSAGTLQAGHALFALLQKGQDRLAQMLDLVRSGQPVPQASGLIDAIRTFSSLPEPAPATVPITPGTAEGIASGPERGQADMVKVPAEVLDTLGNLAGEASIIRSRIEQQVNDGQAALLEMDITLERMREQLRRLDTEAQARVLSRRASEPDRQGYEDFDPLEMDRHSQLQQLSRSLFEAASDLFELKDTLSARALDAQTLLGHQARVNTDLQEGLMRTRMVPFGRLLPRLQRIIRQVADELGKQVEFDIGNPDGEMDRSVLERMIAPLEHMLRNAVDHGLESTEARLAAGKPAQGRISLKLVHEGSEVVLEMSDDGAGVPLAAVRHKAIKRGLLDPASDVSDHDILQFILQPGFSTAAKVTQISGRGLGMDVVHEEVKQLGGSMTIHSSTGSGATFRIRLPFSVSINRALMVQCGDELYAVPLNTVEGIVRVPPAELAARYQSPGARYVYGGQDYELRYLGDLLHCAQRPPLLGQTPAVPLLLIRSHDQQVAVQVDALAGSREIVVKGLGVQMAAVQGLSGATIQGDGRVVLILDLLAQIRAHQARQIHGALHNEERFHGAAEPAAPKPLVVMVVDDSVTVRKVTSRLLERHGMQVLTARDGVEALALLREQRPDVLLLDIEMPRMDGFEVATQIRRDPQLVDLPIIMITSRTGAKHRDRALAIGVNDYLGKPYQEAQLLDSIAQWSAQHA